MLSGAARHALVALGITVGLSVAACSQGSTAPPTGPTLVLPSPRAVNATAAPLLPTDRFALPPIDYAGFQTLLRQLRGTPVVVNLWGSWCGPCRQEAPTLARVADRFDHRVQFLGVDEADPIRAPAQQHIRDFALPYPSVFDPSRAVLNGLGYLGPPITLVYDARGDRVKVFTGPILHARDLASVLRKLD